MARWRYTIWLVMHWVAAEPVSVTFSAGHGQLTAQHAFPDNGIYSIHVRVSDDSLPNSVTPSGADATALISNVAPTLIVSGNRAVVAGSSVSLMVGTFTDPGFDDPALGTHESFSATINWGDGSATNTGVVTVVQGSAGVLTSGQIVGTHTYATLGTFQVTVTLSDDDGGSSQGTFNVSTRHRFAVVDQSAHELYTYDSSFNLLTNPDLGQYNSSPRGITSTATGDTFWVIDGSRRVLVYDRAGNQLGQWNVTDSTQPQGIATDGTNLWMVGAAFDRVYYYAGAASRLSGQIAATSSFALTSGNNKPSDIVTDGQKIWVTDEGTTPKVYVYNMSGGPLGSWTIDSQNTQPSGIALDPVTGTMWIVDRHTAKVYEYPGASAFTSGSHSAASQHALAANDVNPEGITDPTIPINIGDTVNDSISTAGEIDLFPFTATAGQSIFIDFQQLTNGTLQYVLKNSSGQTIDGSTSFLVDQLDRGPITLAGGNYTIQVQGQGTNTPSYQFKLWNVAAPDVTTIHVGDVANGAISSPGTTDDWVFSGAAGQNVFVDFQQFSGNATVQVKLISPTGTTLTTWSQSGTDLLDNGPLNLPTAGNYTLRVTGLGDDTFTYRFQLWNVPAPDVTTINVGDIANGAIETPGVADDWKFAVTAGQKIYVDFQQIVGGATLATRLLDPSGNTVYTANSFLPNQIDRGPLVLTAAGIYTLHVAALGDDTSTYRFQVWNVPPDNLQTIPTNFPISGQTNTPVERIVYSFQATAGEQYFFDVTNNPQGVYFTLNAPSGSNIFQLDTGDQLLATFAQTGTYQLIASSYEFGVITSRFGPFSFQMQQVAAPTIGPRDSVGTDFWVAFPQPYREILGGTDPIFYLQLGAEQDTSGTIMGADGFYKTSFYVHAGETLRLQIPTSSLLDGTNSQRGLHIRALKEISVYGLSYMQFNTEVFTALPVDALGTDYEAMSYGGGSNLNASQLDILATANGTTVTITPSVSFSTSTAGVPFTITLNAGDGYQLNVAAGLPSNQTPKDLTGTIISANKPIVTYSGHRATVIPAGFVAANQLVEQLPSVETWGRRFVTVPFATRLNGDRFRYLAKTDGTEVRVNGTLVATLNRGQFFEQVLTQASEITASQPILVAQFAHSNSFDGQLGDPTMMLVPPYEQFLTDYEIATPLLGFDVNYINVAVASSAVGTVTLDGNPIAASRFSPIGSSGLSGAQVAVAPGAHRLTGPSPFGAFSYGFASADAYGYPGGFNLSSVANVTQLALSPHNATVAVGTLEALQATVTNQSGQPIAGVRVDFMVSGPNGTSGFAFTDALGHANFSYSGALPGTDAVNATVGTISDSASIFWSATPPSVVFGSPTNGSEQTIGSLVLITGTAQVGVVGSHIAGVTIDGHSVDSLDAAGHFFATVQIAAGANSFTVTAIDSLGQTGHASLLLVGVAAASGFDFGQAQDLTAQAALRYAATSYNRQTKTLNTQALLTNKGQDPLRGPVLAVFDRIDPASVTLATSEGTDPAGHPWIGFDTELGSALAPGSTSQAIAIRLANSEQQRFEPFVSLHAAGNLPPVFTSAPVALAVVGRTFTYAAAATDPNNDALAYRVKSGPTNLTINSATGLISWVPAADQIGTFQVQIEADDGFGGVATQQFQVSVVASYPNRPPVFQSAPQTLIAVGANYVYQPIVTDPDGDALQFFLDSPTTGFSINSTTGRVDFPNAAAGGYQVTIRAEDGHGGRATQSYALTVGSGTASGVAQIVSTPPVQGIVGELYYYLPHVVDSTRSTFVFSLPQFPPGMTINSATGEIRWTPAGNQTGLNSVTLQADDQHGGVAVQRFAIDVATVSPNQPPVFDSTPPLYGTEGAQFVYLPAAHDPEGQSFSFVLDEGPLDATFNTQTGQITWTPTHSDLGFHRIRLRAVDSSNAAAEQTFFVEVRPPNAAPQFSSPEITTTIAGSVYRDMVTATDADDAFTFSVFDGPSGMSIDPRSGLLFWHSTIQDAGPHPVTLRVTDDRGAYTDRTFTLTATSDDEKPVAFVKLSEEIIDLATTPSIDMNTGATDNVGVTSLALTVNGSAVPLFGGHATFAPPHPGLYTFIATATDAAGNSGTASKTLRVLDPNDTTPPVVDVTSPSPGATVTYLTDVMGSVSDDNLEFYRLQVSPAGADEWTTFFEGNSNVTAGLLGTFDPTLLQRDIYDLRVLAQDVNGQQTAVTLPISIEAQAVLGNFTLQFTDLSIPLAGIPIEILRTYDTLDASRSGDFGYGWSLGFREPRIRETVRLSAAEQAGAPPLFSANPFREGTRVYLTNPEGRRVGFTFAPTPEPGFLGTIWHPHFVADPGVFDTLSVEDIPLSERPDGTFTIYLAGFPFNPNEYFLTTKDQLTYHYDQSKGLLDVHDRNNVTLTFGEGGITSSVGQSIQFQRDAQGRIKQIIDPAGHPLTYTYDASGDLITYTNQVGLGSSYTYLTDHPHYLDQVHQECGCGAPFIRTDYDESGRLKGTTDALGHTAPQSYDVANNTEVVGDREGHETTLVYDDRGNIVSKTDPLNRTTTFVFDSNDNMTSTTDPRNNTTTYVYDSRGNVTQMIDASNKTWTTTYNAANDPLIQTDPLNRTVEYHYDANGNLQEFVNAANNSTSFTNDAQGRLTSSTDTNNHTSTYSYATIGAKLPTRVTSPDQTHRDITYNELGQVVSVTDERGNTSHFEYDFSGRLLTAFDGANQPTTYGYENRYLTTVTDPVGRQTRYAYDDAGRRVQEIDAGTGITTYAYDGNSQITSITDQLNRTTQYGYDAAMQLVTITDPRNAIAHLAYDGSGNQSDVTDPLNQTTHYVFDALNRVISRTDPLNHTTSYTYDDVGNLKTLTDRLGRSTEWTYDDLNRPRQEVWRDSLGTVTNTLTFAYDAVGNLLSAGDDFSSYAFIYDSLNRLVSSDNAGTPQAPHLVLTYGYDAAGNVTSTADNFGTEVDSTYDARNLLSTRQWHGGGIDPARVDFTYNLAGQRAQLTRFSDLAGTQQVGRTNYGYDAKGRLNEIVHRDATDAVIANYNYVFDLADQLASETNHGQTTTYLYDLASQLTSADHSAQADESYSYDANGNRNSNGFVAGANNQLASEGHFNYSYDAEGNLATKTTIATGTFTSFSYDNRNRLTSVVDRNSAGVIIRETTFVYDVFDRRISKTVDADGAGPQAPQTERFAYEGLHAWADFNSSGVVTTRYLYGDGIDELLARFRPSENTSWYLTDHLGTVRDIASVTGSIVDHIDYDSFGNIITETNTSEGDRFTFTGRELDGDTGLYYFRARYYDPSSGRFILQDPIGFGAQDTNLYRYVSNSPLTAIDPVGLADEAVGESVFDKKAAAEATEEAGPLGIFMRCVFQETAEGMVFQVLVGAGVAPVGVLDLAQTMIQCAFQSRGSTGRTVANNLKEKLAMEQAMSKPAAGKALPTIMNDPRWPASDGWVKMSQNINGIEIHYVMNKMTGFVDDFKFK